MSDLVKKLRLQAGHRALLLNAPDGYRELLGELPSDVELEETAAGEGLYEFVHVFVRDAAEMRDWAPQAIRAVKRDGLLWISYPKKSGSIKTDINRDHGWEVVYDLGYDGVAQVAIDATWSALRFRPLDLIADGGRQAVRTATMTERKVTKPEDKIVIVPDDLQAALDAAPDAKAVYEGLAYSHRKEYVRWITEAKREETRKNRVEKTIERLLQGLKNPHLKA